MSVLPPFAAIGIYLPGVTKPSLMSVAGRVVVFDHARQAAEYLPLLGGGRVTHWADSETACWSPLDVGGVNRACVLREYDPYALPPGLAVSSETRGREWRYHVHAAYIFHDCGQMVEEADGTVTNRALK